MPYPAKVPGAQICMTVTHDGVTVYGNRQAFKSLAEWMSWIGSADESEHYECHLRMFLQSDASLEGKVPENVFVLFDKSVAHVFTKSGDESFGFELTFMAVEPKDLVEMARYQSSGLLPDHWNEGSSTQ